MKIVKVGFKGNIRWSGKERTFLRRQKELKQQRL
jgi:hypothetical protein